MRKRLLPLARAALMVAATLPTPLANAAVSAAPSSIRRDVRQHEHCRACAHLLAQARLRLPRLPLSKGVQAPSGQLDVAYRGRAYQRERTKHAHHDDPHAHNLLEQGARKVFIRLRSY